MKDLGRITNNFNPHPLLKTMGFIFIVFFMSTQAIAGEPFLWDSFSNEQIVNAIYKAEGGAKAQYAYGIRSIPYGTIADARRYCFNSVRNGRARWIKAGKPFDLVVYIGLRYCPPVAHKLNSNWVSNVKWFLQKEN